MTEYEAYEFAKEIFKNNEGRDPEMGKEKYSKDESAIGCIHEGIMKTLMKFGLLKE
jgi:hypothetical protein